MAATRMNNKQFLLGGLIGFSTVTALGLLLVFFFHNPEPQIVARPTPEPRAEVKPTPEPKVEPKSEPKVEPKIEPKVEPKVEPKSEPKVEPKSEPKVEPKSEPKKPPEVEAKTEPKNKPEPEQRLAVPAAAEQAKADKLLKTVFREDYAKKKPADLEALAGKLLEKALESRDNMTERFVMLSEARELATRAGDWPLVLQAIVELSKDFLVDAWELKATALEKISQQTIPLAARRELVQSALALAEEPLAEDNYPLSQRLLKVAEAAAQKASDSKLLALVQAQVKKVLAMGKEFETIKQALEKLKEMPLDPQANLLVGKFLCLQKANWEQGLPLLALGNDAPLREAAKKDLASPADAAGQAEVGDSWWHLGEEQKLKPSSSMHRRAFFWYARAFPKLTGLTKNQVEKRMSLVPETADLDPEAVGLVRAFEPMPGSITGLAVSADSRQIVATCDDGTMAMWLPEGKKIRTFDKHPGLASVSFSPNGLFVAAGSSDHLLQLWSTQTGKILKKYTDYNMAPLSKKGKNFPRNIKGHIGSVTALAFSNDGRKLASGGKDGRVILWDPTTAKQINYQQPYFHRAGVEAVSFAPNGRWLATGTSGFRGPPTVFIWDTVSHEQLHRMEGHGATVSAVAFTPNGKWVVSGSEDNTLRLWDPFAGREVRRFLGHTEGVRGVAVSPDSRRALSASLDGTVRLWDLENGAELFHFTAGKGGVEHVAFLGNGRRAVTAGQDRTVRLWSLPR